MESYYWFSMFVALNGIILVVLSTYVSVLRIRYKVSHGDGDNKHLRTAIRTHANGMEQAPIFALVLLGLVFSEVNQMYLAFLALLFTFTRICHAIGMIKKVHVMRRVGAGLTYLLQIIAALSLLLFLNC